MVSPIRLAILVTDTHVTPARAQYGPSYGWIFHHWWTRTVATLEPPQTLESQLTITFHDVVNDPTSYPDPNTVDGILITGSRSDAFADEEWILTLVKYVKRALDESKVKIIGVCFGHQIIARALGAEVGRSSKGWEVSVSTINTTVQGKAMFGVDQLKVFQSHRDYVKNLPLGTMLLAENDFCPIQGMLIPGRMVSIQGHPEHTPDVVIEALNNRRETGIIQEDLYQDAMGRASNDHDGLAIGRA